MNHPQEYLSKETFLKLLECQFETSTLDYKESVDLSTTHGRVELAKDVLAMANSKGGHIIIGVQDGTFGIVGVGANDLEHLKDGKGVNDKLGKYVGGHIAVHVAQYLVRDQQGIVVPLCLLYVPESRFKVPAQENGVYPDPHNPTKQVWCFRKGDVFIRRSDQSTKVETPEDLRRPEPRMRIIEVDDDEPLSLHRVDRSRDSAGAESVFVLPSCSSTGQPISDLISHVASSCSAEPSSFLPQQLTSFVGREQELCTVQRLLEDSRLVTLTGSGGCGKTRLALKVAGDNSGCFNDGVWAVDFSSITNVLLVPQAIATAIGIREEPGQSITQTLLTRLFSKKSLLVLDNCEHLVGSVALLVEHLLQGCPRLQVLATSREALSIGGEVTFRCPSLSVPDPNRGYSAESLLVYDAVKLFIERARNGSTVFEVNASNAPFIAQICHCLDGIPLAIELAAARVKAMSPEQISVRLNDRFRLLTGGRRTALPRQQTLRGTIDWSYDLLTGAERSLLNRASVFNGGWTLEAAEAVCADDEIEVWEVVDLLTQLLDKSLINFEEQSGATRYRMLETVRQYGHERLSGSECVDHFQQKHLDWFLQLGEQAESALKGSNQGIWLDKLETEHENFRSALTYCKSNCLEIEGLRLAGALWRFWYTRGYYEEGRAWLTSVLTCGDASKTALRARCLRAASLLAQCQGDDGAARALATESLAIRRKMGDEKEIALALGNLGIITYRQGDYATARTLSEESLAMLRRAGDNRGMAADLNNLANISHDEGEYDKAKALFDESIVYWRESGDLRGLSWANDGLARIACAKGDFGSARAHLNECLRGWQKIGHRQGIALALERFAGLHANLKNYEEATLLFSSVNVLREVLGMPVSASDRPGYDACLSQVKSAMGATLFEQLWCRGQSMDIEDAISCVMEWNGVESCSEGTQERSTSS